MPRDPLGPWGEFLRQLDAHCTHEVHLHCCGGFVMTMAYGAPRTTADLDVLAIVPGEDLLPLAALARQGSTLHRTYGVYLDVVTVATLPESYRERMTLLFPGAFQHLRLMALDPYDLALAKLERNADRDRADIQFLASTVPLDVSVLRERYEREIRGYLGRRAREDLTLEFWIEMIREVREVREGRA